MSTPSYGVGRIGDDTGRDRWSAVGMTVALIGTLAGLALIDSTSIGTLLLPVWFLLMPQGVRVGRYLLYLVTIAAFYLAVGVVLLLGGRAWLGDLGDRLDTTGGGRVLLVVGLVMLLGSFFMEDRKDGPRRKGRILRWRDRAMGPAEGVGSSAATSVIGLALLAGTVEVATMLPYLGAVGLLAASDTAPGLQLGALAAYCALMVLPALVLLVLRVGARGLVEPLLVRVASWMERASGETLAWVVGIAGFLLARSSWQRAGVSDLWSAVAG